MAKRDVEEYFLDICRQYKEMRNAVQDLENITDPGLAEHARKNLPAIKANVKKLQENYERISWLIFLLNKPNRPEKKSAMAERESAVHHALRYEHEPDQVYKENEEVINFLKDFQEK